MWKYLSSKINIKRKRNLEQNKIKLDSNNTFIKNEHRFNLNVPKFKSIYIYIFYQKRKKKDEKAFKHKPRRQ